MIMIWPCIYQVIYNVYITSDLNFQVCGHKWADISEYSFGLAILNDSKYGYSCLDNVLRLSLLRSPKAPDMTADMGTHKFTYAIMPHTGSFQEAGVIQQAYNLNCPLYVGQRDNGGDIALANNVGTDPTSFFKLDTPQVILETVKRCEKKVNSIVLRVYEAFGGETRTCLMCLLPFTNIYRCNGLEDQIPTEETIGEEIDVGENEITFTIKSFQVISFIIDLQ
ncbi:alpha-mannosidase 2C1-like [Argopecten irradians]|uniref:alpha-mannosidase 2C1-like n=1 Tax=Argopecten irradians TaxID=31199 RepID=UPI003718E2A8